MWNIPPLINVAVPMGQWSLRLCARDTRTNPRPEVVVNRYLIELSQLKTFRLVRHCTRRSALEQYSTSQPKYPDTKVIQLQH